MKSWGIYFFLVWLIWPVWINAVDSWPADSGITIATFSEPSGAVWHAARNSLLIIEDNGDIRELSDTGTLLNSWHISGDLEGAALAENSNYLYIGIEYPERIVEFDLIAGALTGKSWNISSWMNGNAASGLEGLTYHDGYFYAGSQLDGKIYVFNVDLNNSGVVSYISTITPNASYVSDISGLDYLATTKLQYVIYDTYDRLVELSSDNTINKEYVLPGEAQEGVALKADCATSTAAVFIAQDSGTIVKYNNYPIICDVDVDGDNDNDNTNSTDVNDTDNDNDNDGVNTNTDGNDDDNNTDTLDNYLHERYIYINGIDYLIFKTTPIQALFKSTDLFTDNKLEIVVLGIYKKHAKLVSLQVENGIAQIKKTKTIHLHKKIAGFSLSLNKTKQRCKTRFNDNIIKTWQMKASGTFYQLK